MGVKRFGRWKQETRVKKLTENENVKKMRRKIERSMPRHDSDYDGDEDGDGDDEDGDDDDGDCDGDNDGDSDHPVLVSRGAHSWKKGWWWWVTGQSPLLPDPAVSMATSSARISREIPEIFDA
ncbi:hypothetical protein ANTRET_LOCUS5382 [Anthophora retusa]